MSSTVSDLNYWVLAYEKIFLYYPTRHHIVAHNEIYDFILGLSSDVDQYARFALTEKEKNIKIDFNDLLEKGEVLKE